jgi:outer membrane biogenesis lipoprotein LolB
MNFISGLSFCIVAALLSACSEKPKEKSEAFKPHDHVWSAQTRALEKAQAVEQQTLDAAAARDQEIDKQSQ